MKGASVAYHDPYVADLKVGGRSVERVELTAKTVEAADAVLVITAHNGVDYALVADKAALVLDTRNALKGFEGAPIVRL